MQLSHHCVLRSSRDRHRAVIVCKERAYWRAMALVADHGAMDTSHIPSLTAEQMAQADRFMIEELGVDVLQLMEAAGLAVATFARERMLGGNPDNKRVVVLCGTGGN